jgi:hypothetical protein
LIVSSFGLVSHADPKIDPQNHMTQLTTARVFRGSLYFIKTGSFKTLPGD